MAIVLGIATTANRHNCVRVGRQCTPFAGGGHGFGGGGFARHGLALAHGGFAGQGFAMNRAVSAMVVSRPIACDPDYHRIGAASWALATRSTRPEVLHCSQQVHPSHSKARQARQSLAAYVPTIAGIEENLMASRRLWLTGFHERPLSGSSPWIRPSPRSNGERRMRRRRLHRPRSDGRRDGGKSDLHERVANSEGDDR
jgi:hypothetical protein